MNAESRDDANTSVGLLPCAPNAQAIPVPPSLLLKLEQDLMITYLGVLRLRGFKQTCTQKRVSDQESNSRVSP